ncbi:MAG: hypothetical protein ACKVYV_02545 [Limisphaerales bacterium]
MNFDLARILQGKHEFRQRLAARPIVEKLALLDALRERTLAFRPPLAGQGPVALQEGATPYQAAAKGAK